MQGTNVTLDSFNQCFVFIAGGDDKGGVCFALIVLAGGAVSDALFYAGNERPALGRAIPAFAIANEATVGSEWCGAVGSNGVIPFLAAIAAECCPSEI